MKRKFALAVHGGSGTILKKNMSAGLEKNYLQSLEEALQKGNSILKSGGTALDAVEATVKIMEDNPLFNAGKGSVFTNEGINELDAAIMDGRTLAAGSVAGVSIIKNPITAARAIMEKSDHIMMIGKGAEAFAVQNGLEIADASYFFTDERWDALQRILKEDPSKTELDHGNPIDAKEYVKKQAKFSTVGAVAVDMNGNLAAATSTGGMTNKRFGRVGDSPIIGAGTYANDICAISCTGWGEYFIRLCAAKAVADIMEYTNASLKNATKEVIRKKLVALGGDGGMIAIDKDANIAIPFTTEGMYRGFMKSSGKWEVKIFKD